MILDGKTLALTIQSEIEKELAKIQARKPGLAFILVGENPASMSYVKAKNKACRAVGMFSQTLELPHTISEIDLIKEIAKLNTNPHIDGILVQLPLPVHINEKNITCAIDPKKDVDGFHPVNLGKMLLGEEDGFYSCTPLGIKVLLQRYQIKTEGKHVVILGRSNIVGKPLAALLMQKKEGCNATVTVAHSKSENLKEISRSADILISALGKPHFITKDFVSEHMSVIDVGINRLKDGKLVGDVDFNEVKAIVENITPVPGGIGPMTIAMLLQNTFKSFCKMLLLILFFFTSCQKRDQCTYFNGEAMAMPYNVVIGKVLSKKEECQVKEILEKTFHDVHETLDAWNPSSEVFRLNHAKVDELIPLSPFCQDLFSFLDKIVILTGGRFDPTIAPLEKGWQKVSDPLHETITSACDALGWNHLSIQNGIFKKDTSFTQMDLGGILKGYCVDLLVERLRALGFHDLLVEWEGHFRAVGQNPVHSDWLIQIHPALTTAQKQLAPIALRNAGLATCQKPSDLIDPLTAAPLEKTPFSIAFATVIAPTCALADALSTAALLFSTRKEAESWAQEVVEQYPDVKFWILSYR